MDHRWIVLVGAGWRPASGYLFTLAFDPFYRWFMSPVLPPELHRPWFLRRCACAYADDFALATASLRESLPTIADASSTIEYCHRHVSETTRSVTGSNTATCLSRSCQNELAPMSQSSGTCRSRTMPCTWGVEIGPGAADHR